MKKMVIALCLIGLAGSAAAQQKGKGTIANQKKQQATEQSAPATQLSSTGAYQAKGANTSENLYIADPVIRAFNMRSNGSNIRLSGSGVLGAPRGTYGFANGQILLRTTDATSTGSNTGNGSVGTGSTVGGVGTAGVVPSVNGKSTYAGPAVWGSARNLMIPDSVLRRRAWGDQ